MEDFVERATCPAAEQPPFITFGDGEGWGFVVMGGASGCPPLTRSAYPVEPVEKFIGCVDRWSGRVGSREHGTFYPGSFLLVPPDLPGFLESDQLCVQRSGVTSDRDLVGGV